MATNSPDFTEFTHACPQACPQRAFSQGAASRGDADFFSGRAEYAAPQCCLELSDEDVALCRDAGFDARLLRELRGLACRWGIERLILFGSRARGDFHRASDIDLAGSGGSVGMFALDCDELTYTPLRYDVLDLEKVHGSEIFGEILRDGVLLYEKI